MAAAQHTYVKVRCEGDRSSPVYATAEKDGEEDAAVFTGSPQAIFIVLHSNAHVMMKVRDRQEGGFFGSVSAFASPCPERHMAEKGNSECFACIRVATVL